MTEPLFPCTNTLQTPNPPFWTTKTVVPKFPQNSGSMPTPCLDKAVHAQGGRGVTRLPHCESNPKQPQTTPNNLNNRRGGLCIKGKVRQGSKGRGNTSCCGDKGVTPARGPIGRVWSPHSAPAAPAWPDKIFPTVNLGFSPRGSLSSGGGGLPPPPLLQCTAMLHFPGRRVWTNPCQDTGSNELYQTQ